MRVSVPEMAKALTRPVRNVASAGCILTLSGCALFGPRDIVGPVNEIMFVAQPDACGLTALNGLEGQHFTVLADRALLGQLRVIWPGQEVMSGVVPDRLNAQISNEGRITRLSCG